jgi:aminoglycoside phosphotransferase (APT) family kinase protein
LIKTSFAWSLVYRVTLENLQGHSTREPVIVKATNPAGPSDPAAAERELRFYQSIYQILPIPKPEVYYLGTDASTGWHVIIMQDLALTHRIPQHPYQWTSAELGSVLRAYAQLHAAASVPANDWLAPRHESQLEFDLIPDQVASVQRAGIWGGLPGLDHLIEAARVSCDRYRDEALSILHNDTTPTNAPLPKDLESEPATLIDWQDVGLGMPEMDLAYIDLQPFNSGRLIPRSELLALYWRHRAELGGSIPPADERAARQRHADLVMALWLTRPAGRVAAQPYPEGSYQRMHWVSQFGIVYKRLSELRREINAC